MALMVPKDMIDRSKPIMSHYHTEGVGDDEDCTKGQNIRMKLRRIANKGSYKEKDLWSVKVQDATNMHKIY